MEVIYLSFGLIPLLVYPRCPPDLDSVEFLPRLVLFGFRHDVSFPSFLLPLSFLGAIRTGAEKQSPSSMKQAQV